MASADEVVKTIISHMTDSSNKSHLSLKSGMMCNWSARVDSEGVRLHECVLKNVFL